MSTVTLGTLKALAVDYADMTGSSFPVDARLNDYANAELANLRDLLISCNEETLMKVQTVSLSVGVSSYALAADFFKAVKVFLLDNGRRYPIKRFAIEEAAGYNTGSFDGTTTPSRAIEPFGSALVTTVFGNPIATKYAVDIAAASIESGGASYTSFIAAGFLPGDLVNFLAYYNGGAGVGSFEGTSANTYTILSVTDSAITFTGNLPTSTGPVGIIAWHPAPNIIPSSVSSMQAGTVELWYAPQLTRLTADANVMPSQLPEGWEDFVALGMARRLLGKEESPAYAYVKELQAELRQHIITTASPRDMGEPDSAFVDEGNRFAPYGHANLLEARIFPHQRNLMYRIMNTVITFIEGA